MPRKTKVGGKRRRRGNGFFGDVWDGIKSVGRVIPWADVGRTANQALKDSKLISTNIGMIPGIGPIAGSLAQRAGYGGRRRGGQMRIQGGAQPLSRVPPIVVG